MTDNDYVDGVLRTLAHKINIETTESGASYPDSFYESRFGLKFDAKTPFFTQNLDNFLLFRRTE